MITAFLLNILLLFSILWVAMGLVYTFHRWRSGCSTQQKVAPQADTQLNTAQASEEHILVGKSKGLTTQIIAATSDVEATETASKESANVIAEKNEDSHEQTEESEIAVDYTLEEVDEEEVLREEILWQDNATTDVSPTSILTDLLAQYKAQLSQEERVHQKLLQAIDKAETEEQEGAKEEKESSNSISEVATHPLDYYL